VNAKPLTLTARDLERGWIEHTCPKCGVLVLAPTACVVTCRCGRKARRTLNGAILDSRDIRRLQKKAQESLQTTGSVSQNGGSQLRKGLRRPLTLGTGSQALRSEAA
jgi:hypothetical protein